MVDVALHSERTHVDVVRVILETLWQMDFGEMRDNCNQAAISLALGSQDIVKCYSPLQLGNALLLIQFPPSQASNPAVQGSLNGLQLVEGSLEHDKLGHGA